MKKIISLLVFGLMLGALVACSDAEISSESSNPNKNEEVTVTHDGESTEEAKEEPKEEAVGTRTNPVKVGEPVYVTTTVGDYEQDLSAEAEFEITISNLVRGQEAQDILTAENQFNESAPEGYEWMLFDIALKADIGDDNLSYYAMPNFKVFTEDGSPLTNDMSVVVPNEFGWTDIYNGGTTSGKRAVLVPVGEDVLVEYSELDFSFFFTTKSE